MKTRIIIMYLSAILYLFLSSFVLTKSITPTENNGECRTEFDTLTKTKVYISADMLPQNDGGKPALFKSLSKIGMPTITNDYDPNFIVAFIVDIDGTIKGERIIRDQTGEVGHQILEIVKTLRWTAAKCKNRKVRMLYRLPLTIEVQEP